MTFPVRPEETIASIFNPEPGPSLKGRTIMSSVATKPTNGIQRKTHDTWCVGADRIIEEQPDGRYNVCDWRGLDMDGLRRLAAVLQHVLADLEADPFAACNNIEPKPEF